MKRKCTKRPPNRLPVILAILTLLPGAASIGQSGGDPEPPEARHEHSMLWGWPTANPESIELRLKDHTPPELTLDQDPSDAWLDIQEPGLADLEKDRRAILAMAGNYRVSSQFVEVAGYTDAYRPPSPLLWIGMVDVKVLWNRPRTISLQYTLVTQPRGEGDHALPPVVRKFQSEEWNYENNDVHVYLGHDRWRRRLLPRTAVKGSWTVVTSDENGSPHSAALGKWNHNGGAPTFTTHSSSSPLPPRELNVRDDYNILQTTHLVTITPTGWVHTQNNRKITLENGGRIHCLAMENGILRFQRLNSPELSNLTADYYDLTGTYWAEVRKIWNDAFRKYEAFGLKRANEHGNLAEHHASFIDPALKSGTYNVQKGRDHARATIDRFLEVGGPDPGDRR
jgi:hypothetical protein